MKQKKMIWKRKPKAIFLVARASARTWAVAFSRNLIPGAVFRSKDAACNYARAVAQAAGLEHPDVRILA
jgi:hypothetical protein